MLKRLEKFLQNDEQLLFLLLGMIIALLLGFGTPLYPFSVLFLIGIVLLLCFGAILALRGYFVKLRLIFLGASIVSVILAFVTFFSLNRGGAIQIPFDALFGIFRSILLASFFSLLERLSRFLEEQNETKTKRS